MRKVEVCSYQEKWPVLFQEEAERLSQLFGNELIAIHHIGSTSVPGLKAKPIIDILPVVKDISVVDRYNEEMQSLGYEPKGEFGLPGRRFFQKGGNNRTHHVHMFQDGNDEITRHLAFRDFLKSHPHIRKTYGELKESLAKQFPLDMESYINGKNAFVKEIERKALEWYARSNRRGLR